MRERDARSFFFAVRAITEEKQRCERVLGLLLPPTLVTSMRNAIVKAAALAADENFDSRGEGAASGNEMQTVVSVSGERFAEAFSSASVLFAEGEGRRRVDGCPGVMTQ